MRESILNDPVFKSTLAERVDRKSFFDVYKANVRKEINKTIKAESNADKALEQNHSKKAQHEKYMNEYRQAEENFIHPKNGVADKAVNNKQEPKKPQDVRQDEPQVKGKKITGLGPKVMITK